MRQPSNNEIHTLKPYMYYPENLIDLELPLSCMQSIQFFKNNKSSFGKLDKHTFGERLKSKK